MSASSIKPDRIPCINPSCRRTASADKFSGEIVCGKCFRTLPEALRSDHRWCWRQIRKWENRITRTSDALKLEKMHSIHKMWCSRLDENWERIRAYLTAPPEPVGLNDFLKEIGLDG